MMRGDDQPGMSPSSASWCPTRDRNVLAVLAEAECKIQPWYFPDIERQVPAQNLLVGRVSLTALVSDIVPTQRQTLLVADPHFEF